MLSKRPRLTRTCSTRRHRAYHPTDARRLRASGADTPAKFNLLRPPALYVQLDDVKHRFLPDLPCTEHAVSGADPQCPFCFAGIGVLRLNPHEVTWYFQHKDLGRKPCPIRRIQLPIMPLLACPLYGLQGTLPTPAWSHIGRCLNKWAPTSTGLSYTSSSRASGP